jgi:hypothetical protein
MRAAGPYDEPRVCWASDTALTEEEAMNPLFIEAVVAERHRDMRNDAAAAERARIVRRARRARRVAPEKAASAGRTLFTRHAAARHAG